MGNRLEIARTIVILDHIGKQVYCGWTFHEGDLYDDYTPFSSIDAMEQYLIDAEKLLPESVDAGGDFGTLNWEWAVALMLVHRNGNENAHHLGREELEAWQTAMFGDPCEEAAEDLPEQLSNMGWDNKYNTAATHEKDVKALNLHLYLSDPSEAAKRAARRLGFTLKPEDGRLSFERQEEPAAADTG